MVSSMFYFFSRNNKTNYILRKNSVYVCFTVCVALEIYCRLGKDDCSDKLPFCAKIEASVLNSFCSNEINSNNCKRTCNKCIEETTPDHMDATKHSNGTYNSIFLHKKLHN